MSNQTSSSSGSKKITIVGGGIIGASIAYELQRRGHQTRIIEKNKIGHGCSYGNAGWMTPCFAMPLPLPGNFLKSLKWLVNPESPLYIKPEPSILLVRWLLTFLKNMNQAQAERAVEGLVKLSLESLHRYEELAKKFPEINFEKKGLLMVAQSPEGVKAAEAEMHFVAKHKVPGRAMTPEQCRDLEPSLTGKLLGGVYFPEEAHGEPLKIVEALVKGAKALGCEVLEDTELQSWESEGSNIKSVKTSRGDFEVESVIWAAGSWSEAWSQKLNLRVPILGGKGYALIVPPLKTQPQTPLMLLEKKIAVTPRQGSLRIAGTLELVNQDFSVTERRVNTIVKGTREFLTLPDNIEVKELWKGLRPCTPDGVPMIGWNKNFKNMMMACGHQLLGLQSGMGTGVFVADLIEKKPHGYDESLFDPHRF